jgi:hypothetical protein
VCNIRILSSSVKNLHEYFRTIIKIKRSGFLHNWPSLFYGRWPLAKGGFFMSSVLTFNVGSSSLKIAYYQQQQRVFSLNIDIKQQHASCTGQLPSSLLNWQSVGFK